MDINLLVACAFTVPVVAIVAKTWLKHQRLKADAGGGRTAFEGRLRALELENLDLRQRVETLETIATGIGGGVESAAKLRELELSVGR